MNMRGVNRVTAILWPKTEDGRFVEQIRPKNSCGVIIQTPVVVLCESSSAVKRCTAPVSSELLVGWQFPVPHTR